MTIKRIALIILTALTLGSASIGVVAPSIAGGRVGGGGDIHTLAGGAAGGTGEYAGRKPGVSPGSGG